MKISFAKQVVPSSGAVVVAAYSANALSEVVLSESAQSLDTALGGALTRAIEAERFKGKAEETLTLLAVGDYSRVVVIGLGTAGAVDTLGWQAFGGTALVALSKGSDKQATIVVDDTPEAAAQVALGAQLRAYRFDKYRTTVKKEDKPRLERLSIATINVLVAKAAHAPLQALVEGVATTRNLVSEPANVLGPADVAREAKKLEELGVKVTILGEKELKKQGFDMLLAVGHGSARDSHVVVLEWHGAHDKSAPIAVVGKGVTFDTGGISIKGAAGMEDMKWDMAGSAVVVGLLKTLAGRKAPVNVIGFLGLVENMPSGTAQRPGDVVTSLSGQTVEVINTDAEGRLVLGDVLTFAQRTYAPKAIIDLATLTGAIIVALGTEHAGLFSNNDELSEALTAAGKATGEKVWRLPLNDAYDKQLKSDIADMKNIGGKEAGSITAAQFLKRFIENDTPWAHLDIAGVTWSSKDAATVPKGATAFGVRLLDHLVTQYWQS